MVDVRPPGRPASAAGRLARYGLVDLDRARTMLGPEQLRLWDEERQAPADEGASAVLAALSRAADPDLALRQLCRMAEAERAAGASGRSGRSGSTGSAGSAGSGSGSAGASGAEGSRAEGSRVAGSADGREGGAGAGLLGSLRTNASLRDRLTAVLGASDTLGDHLVANPGEWRTLAAPDGYALRFQGGTVARLRMAYRRSLLRIAAGDLTGALDLEQTMTALSALADATLAAAFTLAGGDAGTPLAVLAMGKCGGRELNYVSDVDVIFVAATDGDLASTTAIAARLIEICAQVAWPVDAALRPEGNHGPLVRSLASHLSYYRKWARTWEFQALLKARPAAGDLALGAQWLDELQPLIWHAAERPEAVADIRAMRRRITDAIPAAERNREIKRGPGGLRDIEFAVQLLQLVHGRADEALRQTSTLDGLRELTARGYVGRADGEALDRAYQFLRAVEHRLQLQKLRRTHTVPADPAGLRWLAHALGYHGGTRRDAVESFRADWVAHATEVRRLHAKLLYRPLLEAVARVPSDDLRLTPDAARARLEALGFADPAGALRHIQALIGGVSRTAAIQRQLLPVLLSAFADAPEPDRGLLAYRQVSEKLGATPWYLRVLRDEGPVALRLARLLGLSRYVTDLLRRDPEALRLLADDSELTASGRDRLRDGFASAAARHQSPTDAIAAVRALRRRELFRIACADLLGRLDIDAVGDALADVADATLAAALAVTNRDRLPFAIIGMGRLGGYEMSYPSDADVLFVYDPPAGMRDDEASALAHGIAEELRRLLSAPAPDPPLGVDADLRPEGRQGPLVRSLAAYQQYYARWSRVWEAQALLRARFVAGDAELGDRFLRLADQIRYPVGGLSREQVTEIRRIKARVDSERLPRGADPATHAKLGRGGLADVEWTVQLMQLRYGHSVAELRTTRTLPALEAARRAELIDGADATALGIAWRSASRVRNALMLVRGRPSDQLPRHGPELAGVVATLGGGDSGEFVDDYLRVARRARQVFERVFQG
jgi:glutamate-ammonia-ligase adenylyltransferase